MRRGLHHLVAFVFATSVFLACSETHVGDFASYADAGAPGATTGGPLPAFVPPSAFDIRDVHRMDARQRWLRFKVPSGDTTTLVGAADLPLRVQSLGGIRHRAPRDYSLSGRSGSAGTWA